MLDICHSFRINEEEYKKLDIEFGKLCWHAAHQLKRKNSRNNYIDDAEDIKQELQIHMLKAGSYYKRQLYIESCLLACREYVKDSFLKKIIEELQNLWDNRTRHGANRQKFGPFQEQILQKIVANIVPIDKAPDKNESLKIDSKFTNYCKTIVWNGQKSMGKKVTREKSIRSGLVSLSEFDYLQ